MRPSTDRRSLCPDREGVLPPGSDARCQAGQPSAAWHAPSGQPSSFPPSSSRSWGDPETICRGLNRLDRSEEHTSELQSLMRISYAVFCLKKKTQLNSNILS